MPESLAELLKSFRSAAHLSQEALAERAGLSTRTIGDIETGVARTPRLVTIMLIAEALALDERERTRLRDAARRQPFTAERGAHAAPPPLRRPALVGREVAAAKIGSMIRDPDVRLVTLVGPPGVGKTSLATLVAADQAATYEHGAIFVDLVPVTDPALVPTTVALALGVSESGGTSIEEAVRARLADRRVLLVLDNFEHVAGSATWLAGLLDACPRIAALVTSREVLHLRSERVYPVPPLDTAAAAALFEQRAQAVKPGFAITAANDAAVTSIVERLEGLPLAIELAAPRLRLLPPKALAARLERRLPLLGEGALDAPQRHRTMRGAIAWSFDLLAPEEQALFSRLSVLQGGGTLEAAAAIYGEDETEQRSFLRLIAALVEKSMIALDESPDGEPRVAILEMLREYAHERLTPDESHAAHERHARWFSAFAGRARTEVDGADQVAWLARLEREHPNLRAALQWSLDGADKEFGLRLACSLWRFWWVRGHLTEGISWLRRLHAQVQPTTRDSTLLRAEALRTISVLLSAQGDDFEVAAEPCEEAIRLQREFGDEPGLASSLTTYGIILQFSGRPSEAVSSHEESLAIRRRHGDDSGIATSLSNLASLAYTNGDFQEAGRLGEECAAIYRRLGNIRGVGHALTRLGLANARQGRLDAAERYFQECAAVHKSIGNMGGVHAALGNLAEIAHRKGDYALALARYGQALDALGAAPNKAILAATFEGLGSSLAAAGQPKAAARMLGAAESLRNTIGSPIFPTDKADHDAVVARTRADLGPGAFEAEWQIGATMPLARAMAESRALIESHARQPA